MNLSPTGEWAHERLHDHLAASIATYTAMANAAPQSILTAASIVAEAFAAGHTLYLCGNGGSAADCQHMAAEFVSRLTKEFARPALPAIALTTDTSFLTAFTNDINVDDVFARQIEAVGRAGDVLIGISTSGSSRNIVRAIDVARQCGMRTIALMGERGALADMVDIAVHVPSTTTQYIQECHLAIEHIICDVVERALFGLDGLGQSS